MSDMSFHIKFYYLIIISEYCISISIYQLRRVIYILLSIVQTKCDQVKRHMQVAIGKRTKPCIAGLLLFLR